ncbi:MAG TPA: cytochrome P450 [Actinocrinis sp.]|nr:cytochrome P450 [Actinocrinis sp.]
MSTIKPPDFPFRSADGFSHPPLLTELRERRPVSKVRMPTGDEAWLVTNYDDVRFVLADSRFSAAATTDPDVPHLSPMYDMPRTMLTMDPPEHTRLRKLVAGEFTVRRVEALRPRVAELTERALDRLEEQGQPGDLHAHLAQILPINVICELLGVPYEDWPMFRRLSDSILSLTGRPVSEMREARDELLAYMARLVAAKRSAPGDDLLSALAATPDSRISEAELVAVGAFTLAAGYESTVSQIGMAILALLHDRSQYAALVADPELLGTAVEELLRVAGPGAGAFLRIATDDVEISGVKIRAREAVLAAVGSANRDETVFEDAARLDITRRSCPHIAFGHGVHHCLGAALVRLEFEAVLSALTRRFPGLSLAVPIGDIPWRTGSRLFGVLALPVQW